MTFHLWNITVNSGLGNTVRGATMYASLGCIGFGNMGEAFLLAIKRAYPDVRLVVLEKDPAKSEKAKNQCQAQIVDSLSSLLSAIDALVLAIKPQDAGQVLAEIKSHKYQGHILSVLGGKNTSWIGEQAGTSMVARYMPSLSARIGVGAVAVSFHADLSPGNDADSFLMESVRKIANAVGTAYEIPEHLMGAFTGISGSGIAYAWSFIHGLAMGGVQNGLAYGTSLAVVCDMVVGAAEYLKVNSEHPVAMLSKVCSPGGTTIEGMHALDKAGFQGICMDAVKQTVRRSKELEG